MNSRLKTIIEALIFISQKPLPLEKIKDVLTEFPSKDVSIQ